MLFDRVCVSFQNPLFVQPLFEFSSDPFSRDDRIFLRIVVLPRPLLDEIYLYAMLLNSGLIIDGVQRIAISMTPENKSVVLPLPGIQNIINIGKNTVLLVFP